MTSPQVYWDTSDFRLTTRDLWLRQRDGALELKAREDGAKALDGDFVSLGLTWSGLRGATSIQWSD